MEDIYAFTRVIMLQGKQAPFHHKKYIRKLISLYVVRDNMLH